MTPIVSVIIPNYNQAAYIDECIQSVVHQTEQSFEIIAIDDASTDNSVQVLEKWQAKFPKQFKLLTKTENRGVSDSRNMGLAAAEGDWVFFLDSDDFIVPDTFQIMLETAYTDAVDIVRANHIFFNERKQTEQLNGSNEYHHHIGSCLRFVDTPSLVFAYSCWNMLISRRLLENIHFNSQLDFVGEDRLVNYQLWMANPPITILPDYTYIWRINKEVGGNRSRELYFDSEAKRNSVRQTLQFVGENWQHLPKHLEIVHCALFYELCQVYPPAHKRHLVEQSVLDDIHALMAQLHFRENLLFQPNIKGYNPVQSKIRHQLYRHWVKA